MTTAPAAGPRALVPVRFEPADRVAVASPAPGVDAYVRTRAIHCDPTPVAAGPAWLTDADADVVVARVEGSATLDDLVASGAGTLVVAAANPLAGILCGADDPGGPGRLEIDAALDDAGFAARAWFAVSPTPEHPDAIVRADILEGLAPDWVQRLVWGPAGVSRSTGRQICAANGVEALAPAWLVVATHDQDMLAARVHEGDGWWFGERRAAVWDSAAVLRFGSATTATPDRLWPGAGIPESAWLGVDLSSTTLEPAGAGVGTPEDAIADLYDVVLGASVTAAPASPYGQGPGPAVPGEWLGASPGLRVGPPCPPVAWVASGTVDAHLLLLLWAWWEAPAVLREPSADLEPSTSRIDVATDLAAAVEPDVRRRVDDFIDAHAQFVALVHDVDVDLARRRLASAAAVSRSDALLARAEPGALRAALGSVSSWRERAQAAEHELAERARDWDRITELQVALDARDETLNRIRSRLPMRAYLALRRRLSR